MSSLLSWWSGHPQEPAEHPPSALVTWSTAEARYALQSGDVSVLLSKWSDADEAALVHRAAALQPVSSGSRGVGSPAAVSHDDALPCCHGGTLGPLEGGLVLFCASLVDIHTEKHLAVVLGLRLLLIVASFAPPLAILSLQSPILRVIATYESLEAKRRAVATQSSSRNTTWRLPSLGASRSPVGGSGAELTSTAAPLDEATRQEIVSSAVILLLRLHVAATGSSHSSASIILRAAAASLDSDDCPLFMFHSKASPPAGVWRQQLFVQALQSLADWICPAVVTLATQLPGVQVQQAEAADGASDTEVLVLLWLRCIAALGADVPASLIPSVVEMCFAVLLGDPLLPGAAWAPKLQVLKLLSGSVQRGCLVPTDAMAQTIRTAVRQWGREKLFSHCAVEIGTLLSKMVDCDNSAVRALAPLQEAADVLLAVAATASEWGAAERLAMGHGAATVVRTWHALMLRSPDGRVVQQISRWLPSVATAGLAILLDLADGACDVPAWHRALTFLVSSCPHALFFPSDSADTASASNVTPGLFSEWMDKLETCALGSAAVCHAVLTVLHQPPFSDASCPAAVASAVLQIEYKPSRLWLTDTGSSNTARFEQLLRSIGRFAQASDATAVAAVAGLVQFLVEVAGSGALPADCASALPLFALDVLLTQQQEECGDLSGAVGKHDRSAVSLMNVMAPPAMGSAAYLLPLASLTAPQLRAAAQCLRRHQGWIFAGGQATLLRKLFASWLPQPGLLRFDVRVIATICQQDRAGLMVVRRWCVKRLPSVPVAFFRACVEHAFPAFACFSPADGDAVLMAVARHL